MGKGFTLLELIVVIIILGILATLGYTQYAMMIERGRAAEARAVLSSIRTAQIAYKQEYGTYSLTITPLAVSPPTACTSTHYFHYSGQTDYSYAGCGYADRCTSGGKTPNFTGTAYWLGISCDSGTLWCSSSAGACSY